MSSALLSAPEAQAPRANHLRLIAGTRGETTLDEIIVRAWEGLTTTTSVSCPVCHGAMDAAPAAGRVAAVCADCGSSLS